MSCLRSGDFEFDALSSFLKTSVLFFLSLFYFNISSLYILSILRTINFSTLVFESRRTMYPLFNIDFDSTSSSFVSFFHLFYFAVRMKTRNILLGGSLGKDRVDKRGQNLASVYMRDGPTLHPIAPFFADDQILSGSSFPWLSSTSEKKHSEEDEKFNANISDPMFLLDSYLRDVVRNIPTYANHDPRRLSSVSSSRPICPSPLVRTFEPVFLLQPDDRADRCVFVAYFYDSDFNYISEDLRQHLASMGDPLFKSAFGLCSVSSRDLLSLFSLFSFLIFLLLFVCFCLLYLIVKRAYR